MSRAFTALFLACVAACASTPRASSSSSSDLAAVARAEVEVFEGAGDASMAPRLFTDDYVLHFPGAPPLDARGHAGLLASFRAAFPDLRVRLVAQIVDGDRVANHVEVTGTQRGAFQGLPPTGKAIRITGNNVMRFVDGRIAETWGYLDAVTMMQQLGAMPAPPASSTTPPRAGASGTSPAEAKALVRRFVDGFNAHDAAAAATPFSDDYVLDFPGGPQGTGRAGLEAAAREFLVAFPDLRFTVDDLVSDGERVAWRWTMTGTHEGPLGPVPPSARPVSFGGISVLRVRDGALVEDQVRADMMALYHQIGALPPAP